MTYTLMITSTARKQFKKLPANIQKSIRTKLDALCNDPFADGFDVKKMKGLDTAYRLRVGKYRVI